MAYSILFTDRSRKQFSKLNKDIQQRIIHYLESRISINPHDFNLRLSTLHLRVV